MLWMILFLMISLLIGVDVCILMFLWRVVLRCCSISFWLLFMVLIVRLF